MLLTAARVLKEMEAQLYGTVKFIFQPAEEIIQGAQKMHTLPQLADLNSIAGAHVWLDLDVGTFSAEPGPRMACADNIYLTVHGKSSHGAQPHQSVDAILAACAIVEQLQIVASRKVSPLEPVVVSIGTINGGTQSNIIANEVRLSGTVRCFSPQLRSQLPGLLENIALSTAQAHGAVCDFTYEHCTPPTINHEKTTEIARGAIAGLFGPQSLVHMEKLQGARISPGIWSVCRDALSLWGPAIKRRENAIPTTTSALTWTKKRSQAALPRWPSLRWMQGNPEKGVSLCPRVQNSILQQNLTNQKKNF